MTEAQKALLIAADESGVFSALFGILEHKCYEDYKRVINNSQNSEKTLDIDELMRNNIYMIKGLGKLQQEIRAVINDNTDI